MAIQILKQNYADEVKAIKEAISVSRYNVARQANTAQLGLYYSVGGYISQHTRNAKWGSGALNAISQQLQQEMPGLKGFSEGNMRKMRLFYEAWQPIFEKRSYVANEIEVVPLPDKLLPFDFTKCSQAVNEKRSAVPNETEGRKCSAVPNELNAEDIECFIRTSFTAHMELIAYPVEERWFYIRRIARDFWGYRHLKLALQEDLYHQQGTMPNNFAATLTDEQQRAVAMQTFKENNVLDFLHVENPDLVDERDVEQQIVENIKKFMLSLGGDFAFMGNQYRIVVNEKERFIDLLFYHRRMRCLVAIELKSGEFEPEYAGKLNYYLSALDTLVKLPGENPSVGIVLCRDKDNKEVEFALRDISKPMGVATYRSRDELPQNYRYLPSSEDLKKLL